MTRTLGEPARVAVDPPGSADGIPDLLTVALVVPCAAVAVLFLLEIDILANRETRRVLAAGVALAVPVALLALRGVEALFPRPGRAFSVLTGFLWLLVSVGLVALPLIARFGLGGRAGGPTSGGVVRDLRFPESSEIVLAVVAGLAVAAPFALIGLAVARSGTGSMVVASMLPVVIGLATVPISFYGIAMSYDLPAGAGDDRLADTAQSMAIVWLVPAPMAALLAGVAIGRALFRPPGDR
ncbi:MAG: hypothetical protein AVDCRST_MAG33-2023 [uncultured Thermomicrobiales bacterium]|uniref:Uncharacterized protein n=1 Tax=uncultured Thermomicrobiales bacterium TaxID=1645740 RepID=A0A6J4V338_9BACT|nr:MAG: hypothetical protein AVDCRST_MAG33-2023 [uncultured Thermomicrobiales bacterium]